MKQKTYDELVQLKQSNKISWLEFVQLGEFAEDFTTWCEENYLQPNDENAKHFIEITEYEMMNAQ